MKLVQTGGYVLETEEAFFEWLEKDSNIEDLLKSTLQFMEYKTKVASALVKSTMDELDQYWKTKLMARIQTKKTVDQSLTKALATLRMESVSQGVEKKKFDVDFETNIQQLTRMAGTVQYTAEKDSQDEEAKYLSRISAQINQIQTLKGLYETRKKEICSQYFSKKGKSADYKQALDKKRTSIREKVNQFIESFTGESNRRHRLYILNYAIDFAQNWTSFQGNYKLNLLITGGAGLGKTTFAKAIGKLFYEFGFLARDLFQIREKTDFIGQYIGWTPMKTYSTLYGGLESMIFIDEAYSVSGCGSGSKGHDYGQEFIDALVDVSQKTRGLISIVAAGYKSEIHNCFLDKNPGMRRRFPNELELTPYSSIDLDNILTNNVLRPVFETQLNTVLKMDLLKEPELYFQNPAKFQEFGKEILLRLPELGRDDTLESILQKMKTNPSDAAIKSSMYGALLDDTKRAATLKKLAETKIAEYPLILRYRTKIIGLYRFFMQLASFDTNFPSFESMYNAHQFLWKMVTDNNASRTYKYNNYRLMHLIYLSSHQQRREIMKSFLLRKFFSEKEGSLFPNQAGDMDTLAAFIKSQPNLRFNVMPTFEEVTKLYNEYFRSRGGSRFILRPSKTGDVIELLIYHIGGGFLNYTDFEQSVLTKIFKSLTYDGETISALWNLNAQTPEHRQAIIQNINSFYSQACVALLREAKESLKTYDSNEKNEKRLPSGIDIRFLEAEAMSFLSANQGQELGDETQKKYLEYVSSDEIQDGDEEMKSILSQITGETGSVEAPKTLTLDEGALCRDFGVAPKDVATKAEDMPPTNPVLRHSDAIDLGGPPVSRSKTSYGPPLDEESRKKVLEEFYAATKGKSGVTTATSAPPPVPKAAPLAPPAPKAAPTAPPAPKAALPPPPPANPPTDDPMLPLKQIRVFIDVDKHGPKEFSKMPTTISVKRSIGDKVYEETYLLNPTPMPRKIPEDPVRQAVLNEGYSFFLIQWTKGEGASKYAGQGFIYVLRGSAQCSKEVPKLKIKETPKKFYQFNYLGRLDEIYTGLGTTSLSNRTFVVGAKASGPPPPPSIPPLSATRVTPSELDKIYPPTSLELATFKTKKRDGEDAEAKWISSYRKTKVQAYAKGKGIDLKEPPRLYYHEPPIEKFEDLLGKELSLAKEYPEMFVAKINEQILDEGKDVIIIQDEDENDAFYKLFKVQYNYSADGLMKSGTFTYGFEIPSEDASIDDITFPIEFKIFITEDDDNEEEEEEEEEEENENENEIGNVEFENQPSATQGEVLQGAAADLNQLVGTNVNNENGRNEEDEDDEYPQKLYFIDANPGGSRWDALNNKFLYLTTGGGKPYAKIDHYTGIPTSIQDETTGKEAVGLVFSIDFLNDKGEPDNSKQRLEYMLVLPKRLTPLEKMPPPPWEFLLYEPSENNVLDQNY